jgi:hypothetical protein
MGSKINSLRNLVAKPYGKWLTSIKKKVVRLGDG